MRKWKIILSVAVLGAVLVGGYMLVAERSIHRADAAPAPQMAMPVPVSAVVRRTIPIRLEYSARTESIRNIVLQARVAGYLEAQAVADGADVKEGDLLYRIDSRDLQATLDQVTAQAKRDTASLAYARSNFQRGTELARTGWVAKDNFDQRESALHQAEAVLAMDEAAIRTARLNLGYAEIRAPFSGRLGRNQAPIGTLVSAGGTALNTLVQIDPIYVTFNPSETDLVEIRKARASGKVVADILVQGENEPAHSGELTFIDNVVDRTTGTLTVRATIANPDFSLLPGQYVRVRLHIREQPDTLLVPLTAIGSSQLGKYVYVAADGKADQRLVTLGPTDGALVAVLNGVAEGDQVIVGNLQKIGPGAPVQPMRGPPGS